MRFSISTAIRNLKTGNKIWQPIGYCDSNGKIQHPSRWLPWLLGVFRTAPLRSSWERRPPAGYGSRRYFGLPMSLPKQVERLHRPTISGVSSRIGTDHAVCRVGHNSHTLASRWIPFGPRGARSHSSRASWTVLRSDCCDRSRRRRCPGGPNRAPAASPQRTTMTL
jgi:hypothetical protein